jgi:hypothetical protein
MQLNFDFLFIICNINKFRSVVHALIHLFDLSDQPEMRPEEITQKDYETQLKDLSVAYRTNSGVFIFNAIKELLDRFGETEEAAIDAYSEYDSQESVDDSYDDSSDSDSGSSYGSDNSKNKSLRLRGGIEGLIEIHESVQFDSLHCPPLQDPPMQEGEGCDCPEFGIFPCIVTEWANDDAPLNFLKLEEDAEETANEVNRRPNNLSRKNLYRKVFSNMQFAEPVQKGERKVLPKCACAKIRQIYPEASGNYMGFLES